MSSHADALFYYHQGSKHQLNAYARGPESLDWEDQPEPFRRFSGCEVVDLPEPGVELNCRFTDLDSPECISPRVMTLDNLGLLLELSFGLSAWKQFGPERWALRCNPSSGNLHPTEVYLLCTDAKVLAPGVYHYVSCDHRLEQRCRINDSGARAEIYVGLSSIHWREAWKYGERAFRYCQHDVGHALAALSYAAACLGWSVELCGGVGDAELAGWLGLDRREDFIEQEGETPDLLCRMVVDRQGGQAFNSACLSKLSASAQWFGSAQRLSRHHFYHWDAIDHAATAAFKPVTAEDGWSAPHVALPELGGGLSADRLIRQRRSAQHFNGKAEPLPLTAFQRMMMALLANDKPPFNAWNWPPQVHPFIFVHRVEGLEPGLYLLPRQSMVVAELKPALSGDFTWLKVDAPFEFYQLFAGNVRQAAKTLSCHQPIASDSAFSLGMLARFADNVEREPWRYRRLFWECGLLGQILYLEAEAAGVRGTGIGCFFDDAVHGLLGLADNTWQSLYHFTVGEPLEDNRLQTLPAYAHLAY